MNTYRVYVLDVSTALAPVAHVCYLRADKYGPAWQGARAALNADKAATAPKLFTDPECSQRATIKPGDHVTCVRIDDIRPRNVKLDKKALEALISDPATSDTDKLAAVKALLG